MLMKFQQGLFLSSSLQKRSLVVAESAKRGRQCRTKCPDRVELLRRGKGDNVLRCERAAWRYQRR
jgi:hypothetical protein